VNSHRSQDKWQPERVGPWEEGKKIRKVGVEVLSLQTEFALGREG
jgi:hypothetical protein